MTPHLNCLSKTISCDSSSELSRWENRILWLLSWTVSLRKPYLVTPQLNCLNGPDEGSQDRFYAELIKIIISFHQILPLIYSSEVGFHPGKLKEVIVIFSCFTNWQKDIQLRVSQNLKTGDRNYRFWDTMRQMHDYAGRSEYSLFYLPNGITFLCDGNCFLPFCLGQNLITCVSKTVKITWTCWDLLIQLLNLASN